MNQQEQYSVEYTKTIEFLLELLTKEVHKQDGSLKDIPIDKMPIYISMVNVIEEMRWWFLWNRPKLSNWLDQDYLYQMNNKAIWILMILLKHFADKWQWQELLDKMQKQNKRISELPYILKK